jgi:UMF1 family MFS transporter
VSAGEEISDGAPLIDDERELFSWTAYAWANHGWVTTVGTVLIGPWLLALAKSDAGSGRATLFSIGPWHLSASAYPSFVLAAAALLQVLVLPVLGASADAMSAKKRILRWSCLLGAGIAALLATTGGSAWLYAGLLFLAGNIVFGASDVVYNAFLPQISTPARRNRASSRGFAAGYLGGGILLALDLALLQVHDVVGISQSTAVRLCYVSAGLWWAGFGIYAIAGLHERGRPRRAPSAFWSGVGPGFAELRATLALLRTMPHASRYLLGYLFFSDAISAVIALSSTYLTHELYGDDATKAASFLFALILLIQFLAVGGSLLFARIARRTGTKNAILISLVIWCVVVVYAYAVLHTKAQAVLMGVLIALVLGGSQALSRSLYSQMVPRGREATFFGIYEICDRGTSWLAPLLFTVVVSTTGSFRQAILSLIALFAVGIVLLILTDVDRARAEAAAVPAMSRP